MIKRMTIEDLAILMKQGFEALEERMSFIEATMITQYVTKNYLDEKFEQFEMKLVGPMRRQDKKVNTLVNILDNKKMLSPSETKALSKIAVFPLSAKA